jgi:hypothetical protein
MGVRNLMNKGRLELKMSKWFRNAVLASGAILALGTVTFAQNTTTTTTTTQKQVVVHPDGSYTVIEYPVNKEVTVNLLPSRSITGVKGNAHVMRSSDGTKVMFDLNGAPADWTNVYAYAVDASGNPTLLGPITFTNGTGRAEFTTPMNQFMLVLSPEQSLSAWNDTATYYLRSDIPQGYAIVPRRITSSGGTKAVAGADSVGSTYDVPMLGIPKFNGKTTEVRVKFDGELSGLDGKAYLKPEGGKTEIKMRFGDMRKVPANKRFVLWATAPDGTYTKIGQVVHTGARDESEIRGETALQDFGLLVTLEDVDVERPTSRTFSVFSVNP